MIHEQEPVGQPVQAREHHVHTPVEPVADTADNSQSESDGTPSTIGRYWLRFKQFIKECQRVLKVLQKPSKEEFLTISKVSALGIAVIGLIGFILSIIQQLILT